MPILLLMRVCEFYDRTGSVCEIWVKDIRIETFPLPSIAKHTALSQSTRLHFRCLGVEHCAEAKRTSTTGFDK